MIAQNTNAIPYAININSLSMLASCSWTAGRMACNRPQIIAGSFL
jgi:hypothetical protein